MVRAATEHRTADGWSRWLTGEIAQPPSTGARRAGSQAFVLARGGSMILSKDCVKMLSVIRGAAKLIAHVGHDREQILSFHFAGDSVIMPAGGNHQHEFVALADCEIRCLEGLHFAELAQENLTVLLLVLERTTRSLQRCREKAVALGRKTASERVADFLLAMAARIGTDDHGQAMVNLPMSRRDIADSLGLTIETVSRQLGQFRTAGMIETRGRSMVRILDPHLLHARSGRSQGDGW